MVQSANQEIFPPLMELEGSLPCFQEPGTSPCPESDKSNVYPQTHFHKNHFNIILPIMPRAYEWSSSLQIFQQTFCMRFPSTPIRATLNNCHPPLFHYLKNIWRRIQIMNLVLSLSPAWVRIYPTNCLQTPSNYVLSTWETKWYPKFSRGQVRGTLFSGLLRRVNW
jgi:hypothetical protein